MRDRVIRRGRRAVGVAVAGAGMALCLPSVPASAATAWTFHNAQSGKCLEIADWRTDNGAPARQWDCTGGANQMW
ncbi:RICIN domain-containing protein [Streptomyces hundungensis]|uniref:RICIN domain-containing protein n=1 Tax=Streptomyces hundungensis TaxID=1077946 RepID=UPI0033CC7334